MNTLDHNILIDIKHHNHWGEAIVKKITACPDSFCIVNIGASELRVGGVRPDRYDLFESFLKEIGLESLKRLNPLALVDIIFFDHSNICSENDAILYNDIKTVLFPNGFDSDSNLIKQPPFQPIERKRLNQICDAVSLWCHVKYRTDTFVTRDGNFLKKSDALKNKFGSNIVHPDLIATCI